MSLWTGVVVKIKVGLVAAMLCASAVGLAACGGGSSNNPDAGRGDGGLPQKTSHTAATVDADGGTFKVTHRPTAELVRVENLARIKRPSDEWTEFTIKNNAEGSLDGISIESSMGTNDEGDKGPDCAESSTYGKRCAIWNSYIREEYDPKARTWSEYEIPSPLPTPQLFLCDKKWVIPDVEDGTAPMCGEQSALIGCAELNDDSNSADAEGCNFDLATNIPGDISMCWGDNPIPMKPGEVYYALARYPLSDGIGLWNNDSGLTGPGVKRRYAGGGSEKKTLVTYTLHANVDNSTDGEGHC